jgi:hypothetical protein
VLALGVVADVGHAREECGRDATTGPGHQGCWVAMAQRGRFQGRDHDGGASCAFPEAKGVSKVRSVCAHEELGVLEVSAHPLNERGHDCDVRCELLELRRLLLVRQQEGVLQSDARTLVHTDREGLVGEDKCLHVDQAGDMPKCACD